MRPSYDRPPAAPEVSQTPIYDSLHAEYSRLFRTLPGDRSDEEELRFEGFGIGRSPGPGRRSTGFANGSWYGNGRQRNGHPPAELPPGSPDDSEHDH